MLIIVLPIPLFNLNSGKSEDHTLKGIKDEQGVWIIDPTSANSIWLNYSDGMFQELYGARGQTYRHYYDLETQTYTFKSDLAVNKPGVLSKTDWVVSDEFPNRFILRLTNGSIYFCKISEIISLLSQIDNTTLWGCGIESYNGVMAFYLNFEAINGHGQYLWYPRFINGSLAPYDFPVYQIYPQLFVNSSGMIYNKIFVPSANCRNRLILENSTNELAISYTFQDTFLGRTFQFKRGFKYNLTENKFHFINHFVCYQDFDDVGFAYEIDNTPQARGTPYQTEAFMLSNASFEVKVNVSQLWNAGTILKDFYSQIEIYSQNGEGFTLWFEDMEQAGFTEKYLKLHEQEMPDGGTRKVLRVGMYGFGPYTQDTIIEIDPSTGNREITDNYDLYYVNDASEWRTTAPWVLCGGTDSSGKYFEGAMAFDTGIGEVEVSSTSNAELHARLQENFLESGEYIKIIIYNIKGDNDTNQVREDNTQYTIGAYSEEITNFWSSTDSTGWKTKDIETLTDYWASNRDTDDSWCSFLYYNSTGCDPAETDRVDAYDSGSTSPSYIVFDYTIGGNNAPNDPTLYANSGNTFAGKEHNLTTDHTDNDGGEDIEIMYLQYAPSNITIYCFQNSSSGSVIISEGSGYCISTPTYSHSSITNGYRVTWTIKINWNWTRDEENYDINAKTDDEQPESSGWVLLDTDNEWENDVVIKSILYNASAYPNGIEYGGGLSIDDNEWIKGSTAVTCSE